MFASLRLLRIFGIYFILNYSTLLVLDALFILNALSKVIGICEVSR